MKYRKLSMPARMLMERLLKQCERCDKVVPLRVTAWGKLCTFCKEAARGYHR